MTWTRTYLCFIVFTLCSNSTQAFQMPFSSPEPWVKDLQIRELASYFPDWQTTPPTPSQKHVLKQDLQALLNEYTKKKHTQDDEIFFHGWLAPEVERLDTQALRQIPEGYLKPIAQFTNDEFLALKLWQYWMRKPEAAQDPRVLLESFHTAIQEQRLNGMSPDGWNLLLNAAQGIGEFAKQTAWMLAIVGPATVAMNALTEPVVGPISQKFKKVGQRWFGDVSLKMQTLVDRAESVSANEIGSKRVKFLNYLLHGTNAAMTPEDQAKNLPLLIDEVYRPIQNTSGKVFMDYVQFGRSLMNGILKDEMSLAAQLQSLGVASRTLTLERDNVLSPFIHQFVMQDRLDDKLALQNLTEEYIQALKLKLPNQLTDEAFHVMKTVTVPEFNQRFAKFGLNSKDLQRLFDIEMRQWQVTMAESVCLSVQNLLDFGRAEIRNASTSVQRITTTVRHWGQQSVAMQEHGELIRHIMRLSGFEANGDLSNDLLKDETFNECLNHKILENPAQACKEVLEEPEENQAQGMWARLRQKRDNAKKQKEEDAKQRLTQVLLTEPGHAIYPLIERFGSEAKRLEIATLLADWMTREKADLAKGEEHLRSAIANCINMGVPEPIVH